jgi:ligand-binding sensor domain-containing protein
MRKLVIYILLLRSYAGLAQEYSYSRYDSKDGLASSTVYCMTQDKEGFLWFGTELGLSRFDGTHFKNFTQEDGLPDNDIIQLFADSKGRVWLSPFKKTVCYYYKGVIHNSDNDSLLKKLNIQDNIFQFAEDNEGNVLLKERERLHVVKPNGEVYDVLANGHKPLGSLLLIAGRKAGGFWVLENNNLYILQDNRFTLWRTIPLTNNHFSYAAFSDETLLWKCDPADLYVMSMQDNKSVQYPYTNYLQHINLAVPDKEHVTACTRDGAFVRDLKNPDSLQHYLPGVTVSNMFKDSEGNWWFCTFGKGVYRLNSAVAMNLSVAMTQKNDANVPVPVRSYEWLLQKKYLKTSVPLRSFEWILANNLLQMIRQKAGQKGSADDRSAFIWYNSNPLMVLSFLDDNSPILGTKRFLQKLLPDLSHYVKQLDFITVKAICKHQRSILVATDRNVVVIDQKTFKITDTIWHERATAVFSNNEIIYIGTLNGLYQINPGEKAQYLGTNIKVLQSRIAAVREDANHIVWVATTGAGLIALKNGLLFKTITRQNGLASSICRTLFYENGKLWVGTDKGLHKVHVLQPGFPIEKYTTSDGLSSNIIDAVYVRNKKVFVGTPEGLTFFDEDKMTSQSRCDLRMIDVTVGDKVFHPADAPVTIPHSTNSIQFNYVGISFKSNGDIRYRYRLLGLDSAWKETRETFLSYPVLPSGGYQLQLQATNKFDVRSQVLTVGFTIEKLLYEKIGFRVLIGLLLLAAISILVWGIIRRIRKREREKTAISKRIGELEQLSRKAQMNPHFIFNSLNSIQQYVMDADVAGANRFISGFSRLIRQTLDFSSKPEISMEEELDYLTNYLELEKTRLENAFSWSVAIDKAVDPAEYYIPPMILQPFVENSVRHGLRFRKDKAGTVTITVRREGDHLICILEDNGVGRKAAMHYKSISPINYQSKGLSLTADRITMFNKEHEQKITMQIDDLEDELGNPLGTMVTIRFPVF